MSSTSHPQMGNQKNEDNRNNLLSGQNKSNNMSAPSATTPGLPPPVPSHQRVRRQAVSAASSRNLGSSSITNLSASNNSNQSGIGNFLLRGSNTTFNNNKGVSWGATSHQGNIDSMTDAATGIFVGNHHHNSGGVVGTEGPRSAMQGGLTNKSGQEPQGSRRPFLGRRQKRHQPPGQMPAASKANGGRGVLIQSTHHQQHQQRHAHFGGLGLGHNRGRSDGSLTDGAKEVFCCFFTCGLNRRDPNGKATCEHTALENMAKVSRSHPWVALRVICAFIMIFGEELQIAFFPQSWDTFFFVLFIVVLCLVLADMIILICVDPTYFLWTCCPGCGRCRSKRSCCCCARYMVEGAERPIPKGKQESCQFGSFMFWLDFISILSFLPSIPYFQFGGWDTFTIIVTMGSNGYVQDRDHQQNVFINRNIKTAPIIGRAARLARFIRPETAVKISRSLNLWNIWHKMRTWWNRNSRSRTMNWVFHRICCCFGSCYERHLERDDAAVVIQRAWLKYNGYSKLPDKRRSLASYRSMKTMARLSTSTHRQRGRGKKKGEDREDSQVGAAMRELTAQRIVIFIMVALILAVLLTYPELNTTAVQAMKMLHHQTAYANYSLDALNAARASILPTMYLYSFSNGTTVSWTLEGYENETFRENDSMNITIHSFSNQRERTTVALVCIQEFNRWNAIVGILWAITIIIFWVWGVTGFAGPIMTLVVTPIERMIRLLGMLTNDPLGYHNTTRFKKFVTEEYEIAKVTSWTTDVLSGMETSFLMSTILRIGSLMRVGFGSAGVEIIRNNLNSGTSRNSLAFDQTGSTVSCIFLFCDIRSFTDCTEALQEEVFVFTNRIAAVVHSICSAYGGSANKNVGDAFLLSWRLDEPSKGNGGSANGSTSGGIGGGGVMDSIQSNASFSGVMDKLIAKHHQADKALYSVIQICKVLVHDDYFLEEMSQQARERLLGKLRSRKGPVVQIGFGLHAGDAVQGAIGSQRKIDATYLSEVVDHSETLESATKRYGVKVLMSNAFYDLLSQSTKRRCRKVDQILLDEFEEEGLSHWDAVELGETMELYTYDFEVEALFRQRAARANSIHAAALSAINNNTNRSLHGTIGRRRTSIKSLGDNLHHGAGSGGAAGGGISGPGGNAAGGVSDGAKTAVGGVEDFLSKFTKGPSPSKHDMMSAVEDGRRPSWRKSVVSSSMTHHHASFLASVGGGSGGISGGGGSVSVSSPTSGGADGGNIANVPSVTGGNTAAAVAGVGSPLVDGVSNENGRPMADMDDEVVLPQGPAMYSPVVWINEEMRLMRAKYSDGMFYRQFELGLKSYFSRDWKQAKEYFELILERMDDGPTKYFMSMMEQHDWKPPRNFTGYGSP